MKIVIIINPLENEKKNLPAVDSLDTRNAFIYIKKVIKTKKKKYNEQNII